MNEYKLQTTGHKNESDSQKILDIQISNYINYVNRNIRARC